LGASQTLIVTGKRRRAQVDYVALNQEMFGGQEEEQEDGAAPDVEYAPSATRPAAAAAAVAGGSPLTSTSPRRLPDAAKAVRAPSGRWRVTYAHGGMT
jgi:hypothetical protein